MRFKNISSVGDLDIPALGRVIRAGEEFDAPADVGLLLSAQPDVYELVTKTRTTRTPEGITA